MIPEFIRTDLDNRMSEIRERVGNKYDYAGIYAIKISGKIVYVGKSKHMTRRIAEHWRGIEWNKSRVDKDGHLDKYWVLREARRRNLRVEFDVLNRVDDIENLNGIEAFWIKVMKPVLNVRRPIGITGWGILKEIKWQSYWIEDRLEEVKRLLGGENNG